MACTDESENTMHKKCELPCAPLELKRLKATELIVLAMSAPVFAFVTTFGNEPRGYVDRMNLFLAVIVVAALAICTQGLLRFRRACSEWSRGHHSQ